MLLIKCDKLELTSRIVGLVKFSCYPEFMTNDKNNQLLLQLANWLISLRDWLSFHSKYDTFKLAYLEDWFSFHANYEI